jgi:CheY-like chemotaxis protein
MTGAVGEVGAGGGVLYEIGVENPQTVNVLLVDDDDVDVTAVRRAFRKRRINNPLFVARDGLEALEMLRGEDGNEKVPHPYIIILDLNMPRMDGLEFLTALRRDPDHHSAVVFVLTTSQADEDRAASYDKNVAGYILKSNVGDEFLNMIQLLDSYWRVVMLPA